MAVTQPTPDFPGQYFTVAVHDLHFVGRPDDRLAAVLAVIAAAQHSVRMVVYMFRDDEIGSVIRSALIAARRRGLSVDLMVDGFGSVETADTFFAPLQQAGGTVKRFSSRWNLGYFIRNHQKIVIADDAHVLVGGFNITNHYFDRAGDESWEDFGVILSGEMAARLVPYFDDLGQLSRDGGVRFGELRRLIRGWSIGDGALGWALGGPTNRISPWALSLKRDLENAGALHLAAAYFSPSQSVLRRIAKVTRKGQSKLILAGKSDNQTTIDAARSLYKYLLKRGAAIYEYQPQPLHMKLIVIDDISYIGSATLDVRSLFINLEIMLRIDDAAVADYLREYITAMTAQSEQQTPQLHRRHSGYFARFKWGFAYILVNVIDYSVGRRIKFSLLRNRLRNKLRDNLRG